MDHIMTYEEYLRDVKKMLSVYMLRPRFPLFYIGAKLQKSIFLTIMMMATYI